MRIRISGLVFVATYCFGSTIFGQNLESRLAELTTRPEYKHARWGYLVVGETSGDVIVERNADQMFVPASTTKLYTCAMALAKLGPDYRFVTKVVADGAIADGKLTGDLVLIADGDLTLGGRNRADGTMAFVSDDHTYADATSTVAKVTDTDPLTGLKDLAKQVLAAGIRSINGNVTICDDLFDSSTSSGSGPNRVSPIVVNDNVVDFIITPSGDSAHVLMRPETAYVKITNRITVTDTVTPSVVAGMIRPGEIVLTGTIPKTGGPWVRIWPVDNPNAFAKCLFTECLKRLGITIEEQGERSKHRNREYYARHDSFAEHTSLPLSEAIKVTLKVSQNLYASTLPLVVASKNGKRNIGDGMRIQRDFLQELGLDTNAVSFAGGAGGMPADSTTPRATVELLRRLSKRPDFSVLEAGLPILGVDGTLANVAPAISQAKGFVRGKTGTLIWRDLVNDRSMLRSKAIAGVMKLKDDRKLFFAVFVNDVPLPPGVTSGREGRALGEFCEIVWQNSAK